MPFAALISLLGDCEYVAVMAAFNHSARWSCLCRGAGSGCRLDELDHFGWVGDHGEVAGGTSMVVAPIRLANMRSASGGIAWSCAATRYQHGSDFHAGTPITSVKVEPASGCCTACITLARAGSTSAAKCLTKSSSGSQPKPWESVNRCASAGGVGPWDSSAPSDSPASIPKAAMYTRAATFGASVPSAVMIWPPYECPAMIVGPS